MAITTPFIDTNVLIRYFTADQPEQADRAAQLIDQVIEGKQEIAVLEAVIVEAIHVLTSPRLYNVPIPQACQMIESLVRLPSVKVSKKGQILRALSHFAKTKMDFVDCLLVATVEQTPGTSLYSFEKDFKKFPHITVLSQWDFLP